MESYNYKGRTVKAVMWTGQALEHVTIKEAKWGIVGEVITDNGPQWMTPGDWLVIDEGKISVVSPAIFAINYSLAI